LVYLIIVVSTGASAVPVISLAMIGAVYGLQVSWIPPVGDQADAQALIFIIKREFMLVGWMVVYILA
jgi:chitin synthase